MLWFGFVDEHFDAPIKIGWNQHVTATPFGMLLHDRIFHLKKQNRQKANLIDSNALQQQKNSSTIDSLTLL